MAKYLFNSLQELTKLKKDLESGVYGGSGGANLTNYYNKSQVDAKISDVAAAVATTGGELQKNMTALTQNVNAVKTSLLNSDKQIQDSILELENKIPTDANETNKLASQEFVKNQVATASARAISADADGNGFDSLAALTAGPHYSLGATTTPTKNDYAVVKKDTTHNGNDVRYNFDGAVWVFFQEFTSGAGFMPTTAQQNAIDSGITAALVTQINTNKTSISQVEAKITQDKTDLLAAIAAEETARDAAINNALVKLTEETTARSAADTDFEARIAALEARPTGWYEFHFAEQYLLLSSKEDKTFEVTTNIPISDLELEYAESGKSTITMDESGTWTYHYVSGSTNNAAVILRQISNNAIIGRFYLCTSYNGANVSPAINYFSPKTS